MSNPKDTTDPNSFHIHKTGRPSRAASSTKSSTKSSTDTNLSVLLNVPLVDPLVKEGGLSGNKRASKQDNKGGNKNAEVVPLSAPFMGINIGTETNISREALQGILNDKDVHALWAEIEKGRVKVVSRQSYDNLTTVFGNYQDVMTEAANLRAAKTVLVDTLICMLNGFKPITQHGAAIADIMASVGSAGDSGNDMANAMKVIPHLGEAFKILKSIGSDGGYWFKNIPAQAMLDVIAQEGVDISDYTHFAQTISKALEKKNG